MSHSSRKAIAGGVRAGKAAADDAREAIRRFEACRSQEDVRAVLAWAKRRGGWIHTPADLYPEMRKAFDAAALRCSKPTPPNEPED